MPGETIKISNAPSNLTAAADFGFTLKSKLASYCGATQPMEANQNSIKLDQFLKWVGVVQTGGEAKLLIQDGRVKVNGAVETRRGRKLVEGDRVTVLGESFVVGGLD
jgi:ribosome-associated protein